ncbi:MAG: hypothetical protein H6R01_1760 [Burkholderiaceae bacterium]|nr:hypothetical protein [Burkholderiaceae bacterium]
MFTKNPSISWLFFAPLHKHVERHRVETAFTRYVKRGRLSRSAQNDCLSARLCENTLSVKRNGFG